MKTSLCYAILLSIPMISPAIGAPISWQEIEAQQKLSLESSMILNEKITVAPGTKMIVTDILPIDELRVISYRMKITPCKATMKNETSEMVLINDLYGAQLEKNCELNVFLELSDLSKPSLFNWIAR